MPEISLEGIRPRARFGTCPPLLSQDGEDGAKGIVANVPIKQMFLGGIIPALVMMTATAIWGIRRGATSGGVIRKFEWKEVRIALWDFKWELATPVVASLALFSGIATPVEAAAVTAFYAFLAETVLNRDLRIFRDLPRVLAECGLLIGGVLLILVVSLGFTNYLVDAEVLRLGSGCAMGGA